MRLLAVFLMAASAVAQAPTTQAVGTMSQLMIDVIYPTSDAIFYIGRTPPKTEVEWGMVRENALTLAESANLLMMSARARDQERWMKDARLLLDVGSAAYKLAQAKDLDGILALNDQLNTACVTCHMDYRPGYGRRGKR